MIAAKIHPSTSSAESAIEVYRHLMGQARQERAKLLSSARTRTRVYSRRARESAHLQGLAAGREASKSELLAAITGIREHYRAALELAKTDASTIAYQVVEQLIESYLREHPEQLRAWIHQSLESLKYLRPLTLRYHPRCADAIEPLSRELEGTVSLQSDSSLQDTDFALESPNGGMSFSWREFLQQIAPTEASQGG